MSWTPLPGIKHVNYIGYPQTVLFCYPNKESFNLIDNDISIHRIVWFEHYHLRTIRELHLNDPHCRIPINNNLLMLINVCYPECMLQGLYLESSSIDYFIKNPSYMECKYRGVGFYLYQRLNEEFEVFKNDQFDHTRLLICSDYLSERGMQDDADFHSHLAHMLLGSSDSFNWMLKRINNACTPISEKW